MRSLLLWVEKIHSVVRVAILGSYVGSGLYLLIVYSTIMR